MQIVIKVVFWVSVFLIFYIYFIYPILLNLLLLFHRNPEMVNNTYQPNVSLIISAYNEEMVIGEKIENSLGLKYLKDKLEIIVVSDASTDRTDEIVKSYEPQGIKLIRIEGRKGKVFCKNTVAQMAKGDILIFSDANTIYEPDSILHLVKHFANTDIGCVGGELRYRNKAEITGESIYWRYEQWIKRMEGKLGNLTTVNGAIFAIRKDDYEPLPLDVSDDLGATLLIKAKGFKVVQESNAIGWEETAPDLMAEIHRRVRIVTRGSYCLFRKPQFRVLLNPFKHGLFSLQLWSHKVLRWFTGFILILVFGLNILLIKDNYLYRVIFGLQTFFYTLALIGIVKEYKMGKPVPKVIHLVAFIVLSCYAMAKGLWNGIIRGKTFITWNPAR